MEVVRIGSKLNVMGKTMNKSKMRVTNKLPKGVGMRITIGEKWLNMFPNQQRFIIEFLLNREFTEEEIWAFVSMDGIEDDPEIIKNKNARRYKIHKLILKNQKYFG